MSTTWRSSTIPVKPSVMAARHWMATVTLVTEGPSTNQASSTPAKPPRPWRSTVAAHHGSVVRGHPHVGGFATAWLFTRCGLTPTVIVLAAITIGATVYGLLNRPDGAVPQPPGSTIEIDFSPGHPALSPITVGVRLLRDDPLPDGGGPAMTVAIDLSGEDFAHAGWVMHADVPAGVEVNGPQNNPPYTSNGTAYAYIDPGPRPFGQPGRILHRPRRTACGLRVGRGRRSRWLLALPKARLPPARLGSGRSAHRPGWLGRRDHRRRPGRLGPP
jgi:hypothetical protein